MMLGLELRKVTVVYDAFCLSDVSFVCNPGEIVAFVGKNGAGKTTTINAILCLAKKKSGRVFYRGEEINDLNVHRFKQEVGYISASMDFYPNVRVKKVIELLSGVYRQWNHDMMNCYLGRFNIDVGKRMAELSTGTKVKLGLAIALSHSSTLFLLDEPTSGLDPLVREQVLEILSDWAKNQNASIFFSTHITQDIEKIASRVIFIVDGIIRLDAVKSDLSDMFVKLPIERIDAAQEKWISKGVLLNDKCVIAMASDVPKSVLDLSKDRPAILVEDILFYLNGGIK